MLIALVAGSVGLGAWWEAQYFATPGPSTAEHILIIKPGTALRGMANQLAAEGVVQNTLLFRAGVMRRGAQARLKAGEYAFPAQASEATILDMLVRGLAIQHRITIAEGLTSAMAMSIIDADPVLTGQTGPTPPEGSLLPETYLFERGTTRAEILARMRKAQTDLLAAAWPTHKEGLPYMTQNEALTLASIVEKETAIPAERGKIAAVFVNRLNQHIRLESDPTIIYGLTQGVPLGHPLRVSELAKPNPYSTYQIDGLPPTPICNPGRDAILAVLNPPESGDLYFVADGTGGHAFAATLADHNRNVAHWRQVEAAQKPARE